MFLLCAPLFRCSLRLHFVYTLPKPQVNAWRRPAWTGLPRTTWKRQLRFSRFPRSACNSQLHCGRRRTASNFFLGPCPTTVQPGTRLGACEFVIARVVIDFLLMPFTTHSFTALLSVPVGRWNDSVARCHLLCERRTGIRRLSLLGSCCAGRYAGICFTISASRTKGRAACWTSCSGSNAGHSLSSTGAALQ